MLTHAEVHREGDQLVVTWSGDDDVDISVGPSPDRAGPGAAVRDGRRRAVIGGLDPSVRHYVRLAAADGEVLVAAERHIAMDGTVNFRDLGGYRTVEGSRVRWGCVFRSDALHDLSERDGRLLRGLGVRHVCDLRRDQERATAPNRLPADTGIEIEHLPIGGLAAEINGMSSRMMRGEIEQVGVQEMADVYGTILGLYAGTFATVVRRAAASARAPMVLHCTAGKDRTGVAAALLLSVLGCARDTVLDDYELSHRYYSEAKIAAVRPQLEAAGVEFSNVEVFFAASRAVMDRTLSAVEEAYGGIEEYLIGGGLDAATLATLREQLLA